MRRSRPRESLHAIRRVPFSVASVTEASGCARSWNVDFEMLVGTSVENHTNPATCPFTGAPSGMRNFSEASEAPSRESQLPSAQSLSSSSSQLSHPSPR